MPDSPLRVTEAARQLDMSTKRLLELLHEGTIPYVMQDGIAHVSPDAIAEYQSKV